MLKSNDRLGLFGKRGREKERERKKAVERKRDRERAVERKRERDF